MGQSRSAYYELEGGGGWREEGEVGKEDKLITREVYGIIMTHGYDIAMATGEHAHKDGICDILSTDQLTYWTEHKRNGG